MVDVDSLLHQQLRVRDLLISVESRLGRLSSSIVSALPSPSEPTRDQKAKAPVPRSAQDVKSKPTAAAAAAAVAKPASKPVAEANVGPLPAEAPTITKEGDSAVLRRLSQYCFDSKQAKPLDQSLFKRVSDQYYNWPLTHRQATLGAPSIHHLCKTIIMENIRWSADQSTAFQNVQPPVSTTSPTAPVCVDARDYADRTYSRWYAVVVQYSARLNKEKLIKVVHGLREDAKTKVSKKKFNFRLTSEALNDALSGYSHNAVTPILMSHNIPLIISDRCLGLEGGYIWLGGGEVDVKWRVSLKQLRDHTNAIIGDITYADAEGSQETDDQ